MRTRRRAAIHRFRFVRTSAFLLTSVFGPFSQDDEIGSRAINPLELYHNQVTRAQGPFSPHASPILGIMLIQENISAPTTLLDFPTRTRFVDELRSTRYNIVGISGSIVNAGKVREMCRLVREHGPWSTIVVGAQIAALPGLEAYLDADHIVAGEGIRWFRALLGDPVDAPTVHPAIPSSFGFRLMGLKGPASTPTRKGSASAGVRRCGRRSGSCATRTAP